MPTDFRVVSLRVKDVVVGANGQLFWENAYIEGEQ
jgi:hypothetical protein